MPKLTISIASPLTRVTNPLTHESSLSTAGHVWITLTDANNVSHSYGFAPANYQHAMVAPGKVYGDDNDNYASTSFVKTINISQSDYDKLFAFDNAALRAAPDSTIIAGRAYFTLHYNAFSNSCVDFVWATLSAIGIEQPLNMLEDRLPIWNASSFTAVLDVYQKGNGSGNSGGTGSHTPPLSPSLSSSPLLLFNKAQAQALDATKGSRVVSYDELDGAMRIAYVNGSKESIVSSVGDVGNTALTDTLIQADGSEIEGTIVVDANSNPVSESITITSVDGGESSVTDTYENSVVTQTKTVITDTDGVTKNSTKTYAEGGTGYDEHTIYTAADGRILEEAWQMQDGSSHSTTNNVNGTSWTTTNDGHGNTDRTLFGSDGGKLSDVWSKSDGSSGEVTFYANGNIATSNTPAGNIITYLNGTYRDLNSLRLFRADGAEIIAVDHSKDIITDTYDSNGLRVTRIWQSTDGQLTYSYYRADGSIRATNSVGPEGNSSQTFDEHGFETSAIWSEFPAGEHGSRSIVPGISSSAIMYLGDGSYTTAVTTRTSREEQHYDLREKLVFSEKSTNNPDGTVNAFVAYYQADGSYNYSNSDYINSSATYNHEGVTYDGLSGVTTRTWSNVYDGRKKIEVLYPNGKIRSQKIISADGSSVATNYSSLVGDVLNIATDDGHGNLLTNYFDTNGVRTSDSWQHSNGDYGYDDFDGTGKKVSDSWHHYDGSEGTDTFNADGSFSSSTADSQGNCKTSCFDSDGMLVSDNWTHSDGSYGAYTLNADNSSLATRINTDGSAIFVANDGRGNGITTQYDRNGKILNDTWTKADGSHGSDSFNADGSSVVMTVNADGSSVSIADDGKGYIVTTQFDDKGTKLSDTWISADGSHGTDSFNADGSSIATAVNADGSSSRIANDGKGLIATILFDNNGIKLSETWSNVDGSHGEIHYDAYGELTTTTAVDKDGNTTLTGGGGDNILTGGAGADTLNGGAGNDTLDGGNGSDTYVFNAGGGVDTIQDSGTAGTDTLVFGQGITPDSLTLGLGSLLIKVGAGNDAIHIKNFNPNNVLGSLNIENFKFADGTILTYAQLVSRGFDIKGSENNDTLTGTNGVDRLLGLNGNDSLSGGDGDDVLDGGTGNDYLDGGIGNDTFLFGRGDGQDIISTHTFLFQNSGDVVQLKSGIQPSDVALSRQNDDLILNIVGTQDRLTISSYFYNEVGGVLPLAVKSIRFADGWPAWDFAMVKAKSLQATDGDDRLIGTGSDETIAGLGGNDYIDGLGGNDILQGGNGADTLSGGLGNDILDGGSGDDLLYGGAGNDIYLFGSGAGHDSVVDYDPTASTVRMSAEILPENVTVTRDATNLYLSLNGGADRLNLSNWFNTYALRELKVEFANGATWDTAALLARLPGATTGNDWLGGDSGDNAIDGLSGNDTIWGLGGNDTLSGGTGDDYLQGDAGNDVYMFGPGFGLDKVSDFDTTPGNVDTVRMAAGVLPGDVVVTGDRYSLYLSFINRTDKLTLSNWFVDNASKIERVSFADGTVWDAAQLAAKALATRNEVLTGSAGNDIINGLGGDDIIYGMGGADTLAGGTGNDLLVGGYDRDIYLFNLGDGADTIDDAFSYAHNGGYGGAWGGGTGNELRFGAGISPDQIAAISDDGALTLEVRGTSDSIRLLHWVGGLDRVDTFVFADGTVWNAAQVEAIMMPNVAPQVRTPIGRYDANQGQALAFRIPDATFSDANPSDTLALSVQLEDGNQLPAWLYFNTSTHTLTGTPGSGDVGTLRLRVTASDPQGATVADVFDLTVAKVINTAPVVALPVPDQATAEDARFSYTVPAGTFSDVDPGDRLTLSAQLADGKPLPSWLTFDAATQTLSGTPGNSEVGTFSIRISATDTHGLAVADVFDLVVTNVNDAPVVALPVPGQSVVENASVNYALPAGTFADVDVGDRLTLSATLATGSPLPSWLKFDAASASFSGSPGIGNLADYPIRVTASDLAGASAAATFNLSVVAAPGVSLLGTAGTDSLTGLSGNDTLNGGAGADTLIGGKGDDTYTVDNTKDKVVERKDEGMDTVVTSVDYSLPDNVENLTLSGQSELKGTGNDLDNAFRGGNGKDAFYGGKGDDTYHVDSAKDKIVERKNEGMDTVVTGIDYTLPEYVENLVLTGTAGRKGTGNTLDNTLSGTAGNDSLDGDTGADTLTGGAGNDSYSVDNVADRVVELAGEGIDSVVASVSYTLPDNVENLTLAGGKNNDNQKAGDGNGGSDKSGGDNHGDGENGLNAMNGTGNALANTLTGDTGANILDGRDGNDILTGGKNNDILKGGSGNDSLNGGGGDDILDGNDGLDILEGMAGNDTLNDTAGSGYFNGGAGDDKLTGGASADFFLGGKGDDTINTGDGNDVIVFNRGDGYDKLTVGANASDTLTLGGGIAYRDLKFKKSGNNLVLTTGDDEGIEFVNWYAGTANRNVLNLQVVAEAMAGFDAGSADPLLSRKVQNFDFKSLAGAFDAARTAKPGLSSWALSGALTQFHLAASDSYALGGDLAYQYGKNGTLSGIGLASAQTIIGDAQFGAQAQALKPLTGLQEGVVHLS